MVRSLELLDHQLESPLSGPTPIAPASLANFQVPTIEVDVKILLVEKITFPFSLNCKVDLSITPSIS